MASEIKKDTEIGYEYTVISCKNKFVGRVPNFKPEIEDRINQIRRVSIGRSNAKETKSILLVGGTGTGKSSLINSLINQIFCVEFSDDFRIQLFENEGEGKTNDESQTTWITVYEFNHMEGMSIDYNLTIVDTPGLDDTRGLNWDRLMFERLEMVLYIDKFCVDELHCIGIVTPASATRLTAKQKYVYDGCMRLFGRNVKDIINILVTFADGSEAAIIDALQAAEVKYVDIHEFNNSSLFLDNKETKTKRSKLNAAQWEFTSETCQGFLQFLENSKGQSLTETQETLETRRTLHNKTMELEQKFLKNLEKAENLQRYQNDSQDKQNDSQNKQNSLRLSDMAPSYVECEYKAFNCLVCKSTCHEPCYGKKYCNQCKEMLKRGIDCHCNCEYIDHERKRSHYINVMDQPVDEKMRMANMKELIESLLELHGCVNKLKTVALRPIPMSMEDYLGSLIEQENDNPNKSTKGKIAMLKAIQHEEKEVSSILNNPRELESLIRRLDLICKKKKGEKTGCKVM